MMSEIDVDQIPVVRAEMKTGGKTFGSGWCFVENHRQLSDWLEAAIGEDGDWDVWAGTDAVITITFEMMDKAEFDALEPWEA